ncbi:MAG: SCO family protein [Pyrinomonadaceae bacterium]|nr:SCO family protein [Phycisphaerales bacterium]
MSQGIKVWIGLALALGVSALLVVVAIGRGRSGAGGATGPGTAGIPNIVVNDGSAPSDDPLRPDYRVEELTLPTFALTDQDGKPVTSEVFTGHVTVVSFFFTRCTFICPAMTGTMLKLADRLKDTPARYLSFSVDPEGDTPAVLKKYAADVGADTARWTFATGSKDVVWNMLREGMKWGIEARPDERVQLAGGGTMDNIRHPGWFALIGPDGRVLEIYDSSSDEKQEELVTRVRAVVQRMGK